MRKFTAVAALFAFSLSACSLRPPMKRFSTQEEAGTVHVAVQSIARFDDAYTDQLQPQFDITSDAALNAISQTQISEMERLRTLLAEVKLAGAKKTVTSERVTEGGEVKTDKVTEKSESVDPSALSFPTAKGLTNNAPGVTPSGAVSLDHSLRYRAAAALLQEIALFNRYVRDAAVSRGSVPYVVRLLVTTNPSARLEPYDVYTRISFFLGGEPDFREQDATAHVFGRYATDAASKEIVDELAARKQAVNQRQEELSDDWQQRGEGATVSRVAPSICDRPVEIIPLFVTDNLESSLNSVANERVIDASASASGWFANLAAALGFRGQATDRDRSLGRSINGLTTISRIGTNSILARLGAAQRNNQYEMVARTYNVTLLALVPNLARLEGRTGNGREDSAFAEYVSEATTPCRELSFAAYSSFRDAIRGTELPSAYKSRRERTVRSVVKAWDFQPKTAPPVVQRLLSLAQLGRYEAFRGHIAANLAALAGPAPLDDLAIQNTLWHDLVALNDMSGRSYGMFELPEPTEDFFDGQQEVTLYDDEKSTTVVLNGARNLSSDGVHAQIVARDAGTSITVDELSVKISGDRRRATFTFPSLRARLNPGSDNAYDSLEFVATKIESGARGTNATTFAARDTNAGYRFIKAVPEPALAEMSITSPAIRATDAGVGEVAIGFTAAKPAAAPVVLLHIDGATISGVVPSAPFVGSAVELPGHGNYVVSLKSLFLDVPVKVKAVLRDGGAVVGEKTMTVRK